MKSILLSCALTLLTLNVSSVGLASGTADEAAQSYAERSYEPAGIAKAQAAADVYGQLAAQAADASAKAEFLVRQSEALYFVGDATTAKDVKLARHNQGYLLADQVVKALGVTDVSSVSDADIDKLLATPQILPLLADALYQRGVNLAKWGQANGIPSSLGKWPELRSTMELIGFIGQDAVHDFGASRTLGRAYFELPGMLGGSPSKAETFLGTAVNKTLVAGQVYSVNGFNTLYYAEVLKYNGKTDVAKKLLAAFVAADPKDLSVEGRKAQEMAKTDLKSW